MNAFVQWVQRLLGRGEQWREEIESHLEMRAKWNESQGIPAADARDLAKKQFGNRLTTFEDVRAIHIRSWLDGLLQDIRYAMRGFRRSPVFTIVAVVTLAIGIGASTAVFSVVDPLLFRSLPYPRGDRLVSVGVSGPIDTNEFMIGGSYLDWRDRQTVFESLTSMRPASECDLGVESPQRIHCISVEANFLKTLGISPVIGRDFTREEDRPNAPKVALLSYGLWKSKFGGSAKILGKIITLDDAPARVTGVLPKDFEMPQLGEADVLLPEQLDEVLARSPNATIFLRSFARLKDGLSIEQAREKMRPLFEQSLKDAPASLRPEIHLVVRSVRDRQIHDAKLASWMLIGAVLALLLLSCANVANLLLARASARKKELAMRAALGAGRSRLVRQTLTESLVLGLAGGAAGCGMGWALLRLFVSMAPSGLMRLNEASIDLRVLLFTLAVSLFSSVLFGLLPALERPRADALAGWRAVGTARTLFRQMLVAAQIAISLLLLTSASLFIRSLQKLESQPLGFQPEHLVAASFVLSHHRYQQPAAQTAFYNELESRLKRIPGVSAFALSDSMPPAGGMHGRPYSNMHIAGHPLLPQNGGMVGFRYVTPGYFQTMGIPILSGRTFKEAERGSGETPLILSDTLAHRMFGNENPIGQQIELSADGHWAPVVGVAADVKNDGLAVSAEPEYYRLRMRNADQLGHDGVALFRTSLDSETLTRWIRGEFSALDPALPVRVQTMHERVNVLSDRPRFLAILVGLFAMFGLLLAAVGLYGVMSFLVVQQTREIGVRMAMGATPRGIALLVQKRAGSWTGAGIVLGIVGSLAFTWLVRGLLFGVSPHDPLSLAAAIGVLGLSAVLAAWLPSRRAARVDPAVSLRYD